MANTWIFGASGTGKTTLLISRALQCPAFLYVDPHGDDTLLEHFPKGKEALVIDPTGYPVGWNILQDVSNKPLVASLIRDTVRAVWGYSDMATPVMDRMLFNSVSALLEVPGATLLDLERLLTNRDFRDKVLAKITNSVLKAKWAVWEGKNARDWEALIQSTENKAGEFSEDPRIRAIIGNRSTFDLKRMMFEQKSIVLRLPIAELGEQKVKLVGSLFLAHIMAVAAERTVKMPFGVFIDDCQLFDTPILRSLLANTRRTDATVRSPKGNGKYRDVAFPGFGLRISGKKKAGLSCSAPGGVPGRWALSGFVTGGCSAQGSNLRRRTGNPEPSLR